jgi:hypothetical protein
MRILRLRTIILATILLLAISSCAWLDKSEHSKIIRDYEIGWNDLESNRSISKPNRECGEGCYDIIVDSYVYSVGHNERFIIAKQHPNLDTTQTKYFLIDVEKNHENVKKGVYGPMEKEEFEELTLRMKAKDIKFNLNFPERVW